ncbi:MAG: hypothetical protein EOO15_01690 [Chitinophagaceae bacterium]|nr:MAG: hypothetical protein EOO15_01690 [Chitinophagaceae bacterium]
MPAILLTNSAFAVPALFALRDQWQAVFTSTPTSTDYPELALASASAGATLHTLAPGELFAEAAKMLASDPSLQLVCFGFGSRVPASLLESYGDRCYNVHFSLLPRYAGPIPVFWQLRAGDLNGGISIHLLTEKFDSGPIAAQQALRALPGETYGLYSARLAQAAVPLLRNLIAMPPGRAGLKAQDPALRTYQHKPREKDLLIDWKHMSASDIENLVNACNPIAVGAWTWFAGTPIQLLEVNPADGSIPALPGTIVHADTAQGVFVNCCDDKLLRVNIAKLPQGILSGGKLAALGFRKGARFENAERPATTTTVSI